jgi:PAS domain S-box-containing protein
LSSPRRGTNGRAGKSCIRLRSGHSSHSSDGDNSPSIPANAPLAEASSLPQGNVKNPIRPIRSKSLGKSGHRNAANNERVRQSEMLLAQAERLANIGSWELDLKSQTLAWSTHFYRMLGLKPNTAAVAHDWGVNLIHPDDRERATRDLQATWSSGVPLDNELRFVRADGAVRLFYSRAVAITDKKGKVVIVRGMSQDITERRTAEVKLRESEALLTNAEQIANFGSWEFDVGSTTAKLSKNLRKMYELSANEELTREKYNEHVHPKDRTRVRRIIDEAIAACRPFEYQLRYILPTGETRFLFTRGIPIARPDGKLMRIFGVVQDVTGHKQAEEDIRRLWRQMVRGRDEERRRMARELHESAGQSLAALKMNLSRLFESLPKTSKLVQTLWNSSVELADAAVREVRTVSYLMHPPLLDEAGLGPALRWYARGFAERSKIAVSVDIADDFGRVDQELETTVFRVVQEALTNVHRYSGSKTASITVSRSEGRVVAEVRDQGCGLSVSGAGNGSQSPPGVGIVGMRERVQQLNGTFEIQSVPGHGTTVRAILPPDASKSFAGEDDAEDFPEATGTDGSRRAVGQGAKLLARGGGHDGAH